MNTEIRRHHNYHIKNDSWLTLADASFSNFDSSDLCEATSQLCTLAIGAGSMGLLPMCEQQGSPKDITNPSNHH